MSTDPHESHDPYVETRDGHLYVGGGDVRLERLIISWSRGERPEALRDRFPSLSLAAIYGAIAYYLSHKDEVDRLTAVYQLDHAAELEAEQAKWLRQVAGGGMRDDEGGAFNHFTQRASKVMGLAREEAQRLNHNYIGTEHLLLGLVREGEGVAAKVLHNLGVELQQVRDAVERIIGRGDHLVLGDVGLTPRAKKVIELARDEGRRMGHRYVGTEHLLLGLVREGEGIAAGVLESLGVNLEKVRIATITAVGAHRSLLSEHVAEATTMPSETQGVSLRDRFDKFDAGTRKALSLAQEEA